MQDPIPEQLQPFRLTPAQFRILRMVSQGAHIEDITADWTALEERGFLWLSPLTGWQLTAQGEAILSAINELL